MVGWVGVCKVIETWTLMHHFTITPPIADPLLDLEACRTGGRIKERRKRRWHTCSRTAAGHDAAVCWDYEVTLDCDLGDAGVLEIVDFGEGDDTRSSRSVSIIDIRERIWGHTFA
jgi:hypothetical protein